MEFIGTIKEIGKVKNVSDKSYREIVLSQMNYTSGFETHVALTVRNEQVTFNGQRNTNLKTLWDNKTLAVGNVLKALFSISAQKTQDGKWFNNCTMWGLQTLDYQQQSASQVQQPNPQTSAQPTPPQTSQPFSNDDVPF